MLITAIDTNSQPQFDAGIAKMHETGVHLDRTFTIGKQACCSPDR